MAGDSEEERGEYTGHWNFGERNGTGCFVYSNGDVYEGEWQRGAGNRGHKRGMVSPQGGMVWSQGSTVDGRWVLKWGEGPEIHWDMALKCTTCRERNVHGMRICVHSEYTWPVR